MRTAHVLGLGLGRADWWLARSARGADGAASVGRDLPTALEPATAKAMGGSVCPPERAAAASAGRGRTATGRTAAVAVASAGRHSTQSAQLGLFAQVEQSGHPEHAVGLLDR